eukprot:1212845-Pleurochrysis_carterae.AAC.1
MAVCWRYLRPCGEYLESTGCEPSAERQPSCCGGMPHKGGRVFGKRQAIPSRNCRCEERNGARSRQFLGADERGTMPVRHSTKQSVIRETRRLVHRRDGSF